MHNLNEACSAFMDLAFNVETRVQIDSFRTKSIHLKKLPVHITESNPGLVGHESIRVSVTRIMCQNFPEMGQLRTQNPNKFNLYQFCGST